jgi:hypothetical protein
MKYDDFKLVLEAIVLGNVQLEFQCSYKEVLLSVVDCFEQIKPIKEDVLCYPLNDTWISTMNRSTKSNNKIKISIIPNGASKEMVVTESTRDNKPAKNYHFIRKILEILGNDRMLDKACEQYIHALKTKYISLAKVVAQMNKNCTMTKSFHHKKSRKMEQYSSSLNSLILSANLPLTEMEIILQWTDQLKCTLQEL